MEEYKMSPEFALKEILESVPVLNDKVSAIQPKKDFRPPFAFYVSDTDDEEESLDGWTGLQRYTGSVHLVNASYRGLQLLCARVRKAFQEARGALYETPENEPDTVMRGRILVENAVITQSSPDLYESEVGYYRRVLNIRLDYQTDEIFQDEEEEVISL